MLMKNKTSSPNNYFESNIILLLWLINAKWENARKIMFIHIDKQMSNLQRESIFSVEFTFLAFDISVFIDIKRSLLWTSTLKKPRFCKLGSFERVPNWEYRRCLLLLLYFWQSHIENAFNGNFHKFRFRDWSNMTFFKRSRNCKGRQMKHV